MGVEEVVSEEQRALRSWVIRDKGIILVRDNGKLLYHGPESDIPPDILRIADEMQVSSDQYLFWKEQPPMSDDKLSEVVCAECGTEFKDTFAGPCHCPKCNSQRICTVQFAETQFGKDWRKAFEKKPE